MLNFKNREDLNKLMEKDKTYNYVFCKLCGYKNPDKPCTWSNVTPKQIVPRLRTSSGIHHSNLSNVLELVRLLVKVKS